MKSRSITVLAIIAFIMLGLAINLAATRGVQPASAAPVNLHFVDRNTFDPDTNPGDGECITKDGGCSLIAAIQEANAFASPDTIQFSSSITQINLDSSQPLPAITDDSTNVDGKDHVVLNCVSPEMTGLSIYSDENHIRDLEITGCEIAILLMHANNNITGASGSTPGNEGSNRIHDAGTGVMVYAGGQNYISGNSIYSTRSAGITIEDSSSGNTIGVVDTAMFPSSQSNMIYSNKGVGIEVLGNNNLVAGNKILTKFPQDTPQSAVKIPGRPTSAQAGILFNSLQVYLY